MLDKGLLYQVSSATDKSLCTDFWEVKVGNSNWALGLSYILHAILTQKPQKGAMQTPGPSIMVISGFLAGDSWLLHMTRTWLGRQAPPLNGFIHECMGP